MCALLLNDEAYDISGLVFKMYFRRPNSSEDVLVLTEGEGLTNAGVLGTISVVLTAEQLADLVRDRYFFVIEYTVSSKTYPLLQGYLQIKDETNPGDTTTSVTIPVNVDGVTVSMEVTMGGGSIDINNLTAEQLQQLAISMNAATSFDYELDFYIQ